MANEQRQTDIDRLPHSGAAEASVLGALLIDPDALMKVKALRPDHFFSAGHQHIYTAMQALFEAGKPHSDYVVLVDALEARGVLKDIGGAASLSKLIGSTPTALNVLHYAKIVQDMAAYRALVLAGAQIARLGYNSAQKPGDGGAGIQNGSE